MRFSWAKMAMLSGLAVVVAGSAMAQQSNDVRLDLTLKDADMMQATNLLFMRAGISFVVEPSADPYKKITLKLSDVTAEEAVRYICQSAGAYFRRDENGVYVISHNRPAAETAPTPVKGKQPLLLKRIKLLRTDARDVYDILVLGKPFETGRGFEDLKKFAPQGPTEFGRAFGQYATPSSMSSSYNTFAPVQAQSNLSGVSYANAPKTEAGSDITIPGDEAGKQGFGGGGQGFGGGGGAGGQGFGGGGAGGAGGGAGGGQGRANLTGGQGLVPESIDFISYDPTDNSLVVRGNEDDINTLQGYINMFDIAPKQLQVKVEFITTTNSFDKSFGSEFLYQRGTISTGTNPGSFVRASDPVFLTYSTGNITARMRTSLTEGNGKVVSAPIVRTLNNQPVSISSSISTYIFINTTTVSNGAILTSANPFQLTASDHAGGGASD